MQVAMRIAVVAQLEPGVEPAAQQIDARRIDGAVAALSLSSLTKPITGT